jgi:hypothetical protein
MNRYQKVVILVGLIAVAIMGIYPPWKMVFEIKGAKVERFWRYDYIFSPPHPPADVKELQKFDYFFGNYHYLTDPSKRHIFEPRLDYTRLLFQWIFAVLITSGLVLIFHRQNKGT